MKPDGRNVISAGGVFAWKDNEHGEMIRAKARLVGIDFFVIFAPTLVASCFGLLGVIACELGFVFVSF